MLPALKPKLKKSPGTMGRLLAVILASGLLGASIAQACLFCGDDNAPKAPPEWTSYQVDARLLADFKQAITGSHHLMTLTSSVSLFNYLPLSGFGLKPGSSISLDNPGLKHLVRDLGGYYWNPANGYVDTNAPGLYVSIQPVVTSSYGYADGRDNPMLTQVTLKPRTVVLLTQTRQDGGDLQIDAGLKSRLGAIGCPVNSGAVAWQYIFLNQSASMACRTLARAALRDLKVQAIFYPFDSVPMPSCRLFTDNSAAVIVPTPYEPQPEVEVFAKQIPAVDPWPTDRYAIQQLYSTLHTPYGNPRPLWNSLPAPVGFDLQGWMDSHLWGCGPAFATSPIP